MAEGSEDVTARYVYRTDPSRQSRSGTLYLVARLAGSNVVARIGPLVTKSTRERVTANGESRGGGLRVVGPWCATANRRHLRARVEVAG